MRLNSTLLLVATFLAVSAVQAAAPAASKERLRRLVHLPRLSFVLGISFDPLRGFAMLPDRVTTLRAIETTRKTVQGNPGDAPLYTRIGRLSEAIGNHHDALQAYAKAVECYRRKGVEQGDDGPALADFGSALQGLGQWEEAERTSRRAVQLAPGRWSTHATLGRLLTAQAAALLAPEAGGDPARSWANLASEESSRPKVAPAQAEKAQKRLDEALLCYDRAIASTPDESEPYMGRASARALDGVLKWMRDPGTGAEPDALRLAKAMYPPAALPDLRQATLLAPNDPQALGAAVLFELFSSALEHGASQLSLFGTSETWPNLPESARQSVRASLARLEEMSLTTEALPAAAALEMMGSLQCFVVNDLPGAERTLRRAIALDPKRTQSWEMLVFLLASTKRAESLLALCEDRLRVEDTARVRLLLAKACEMIPDWDRVLETTETLQRRYPEDVYANLALAAALVQAIDLEAVLARAAQLLAKAEKLAGASPSREQVVNLLFLRGLVLALDDQIEAARDHLKQVKELDPGHDGILEALEIVAQM